MVSCRFAATARAAVFWVIDVTVVGSYRMGRIGRIRLCINVRRVGDERRPERSVPAASVLTAGVMVQGSQLHLDLHAPFLLCFCGVGGSDFSGGVPLRPSNSIACDHSVARAL